MGGRRRWRRVVRMRENEEEEGEGEWGRKGYWECMVVGIVRFFLEGGCMC